MSLEARIAKLERLQAQRIAAEMERRRMVDLAISVRQLEIDNLKAQTVERPKLAVVK